MFQGPCWNGFAASSRKKAPGIQLQVDNFVDGIANDEVIGDEIHVRLANDRVPLSANSRQRLFEDAFVVVMRRGHAAASKRMNLPLYLTFKHVKVAANAVGSSLIDDALLRRGGPTTYRGASADLAGRAAHYRGDGFGCRRPQTLGRA